MESCASRRKCYKSEQRIYEDKNTIFRASQHLKMSMEQVANCEEPGEIQFQNTEDSLNKEILQLQKELKNQFIVRRELEKATVNRPLLHNPVDEDSLLKPANDLIKEISILEFEVKHLEKYLLSLYRKAFQENANPASKEPIEDSYVHRSHSSLSLRTTPPDRTVHEALDSYHSLPLAMLECATADFSSVGLAEHHDICMSANWLSEEMVKCICAIYCQIADPPLFNHGFLSSPSDSSPQGQFVLWSPQCEEGETTWAHNDSEASMEFSESCVTVVEVQGICQNSQRPSNIEHKEQIFRSLVSQLEQVDPRKLKPEEKLAFWINVHNALVMHAFLVYGTPRGALKRISLVLKAAYNIGGHVISVSDIQHTILGCRLPRPGQWLQSLLFPKPRYKSRDARKDYAIDRLQPLLYFALCSGSHSDPMVRIYMPKTVFQELEVAKEEYIHTNFRIPKGQKLFLPKLVELYAKDSGFCMNGLMDMIEHSVPELYLRSFELIRTGKSSKKVEWVPHNFTFRYLILSELG